MAADLRAMKLPEAAKKVESGIEETLTYCDFPTEHWTKIRTNNTIERLNGRSGAGPGLWVPFPGRQLCADAGLCPAASCSRNPVGLQEVHEYEASGSPGTGPGCGLIAVRLQRVKGKTSGVSPPLTLCTPPAGRKPRGGQTAPRNEFLPEPNQFCA